MTPKEQIVAYANRVGLQVETRHSPLVYRFEVPGGGYRYCYSTKEANAFVDGYREGKAAGERAVL